jgi:hypothetical protein
MIKVILQIEKKGNCGSFRHALEAFKSHPARFKGHILGQVEDKGW